MSGAFYVYLLCRLDGTPCYVGKGTGARWRHNGKYGRNYHLLRIIANAKVQGEDIPRLKLMDDLDEATALFFERFFIAALGREAFGGPLVNLTDGGEVGPTGYRYTDEQRRHHGDVRRGKALSPEWRAKISTSLKGQRRTAEQIENIRQSKIGVTQKSGWWSTAEGRAKQRANNPGNTGNLHSAEAKAKMRSALIRLYASAKVRKAVHTSPRWASQNSIRYQSAA